MAKVKSKQLKINLGCGRDILSGWVNIDIDQRVKPDLVLDLQEPLPFEANSAIEFKAQDILEHFTTEDVEQVISEISRVLKTGGKLKVRVPNVDEICNQLSHNPAARNVFLYGDTSQTGVWGAHKMGFSKQLLVSKMLKFNLFPLKISNVGTNFEATFIKRSQAEKQTKITYVCQTLDVGGAEVFMTDLLENLQGNAIKIDSFTTEPQFVKMLRQHKLKAQQIPVVLDLVGNWKGLLKAVLLLPKGIRYYWQLVKSQQKTDIFLASSFTDKIFISPLAKKFGKPVVWIEFGPISPLFNKFFGLPKLLYRLVKDIPELVIVPSEHTRNDIIPHGKISNEKILIIPCGRNLKKKKISTNKQTKPKIVCLSRLEPGKGQDLLIEAFAKVQQQVPAAQLIISGEGDWRQELQKIATKHHIADRVEFVGKVDDPIKLMSSASVCVFPTVWELEGFGLVLIEAMSLGKPIVAFKTGPVPEIIYDQWNGLLAESGNTDQLAKKITQLLTNKKLANKIAKQGLQDFTEQYQINSVSPQYVDAMKTARAKYQSRVELERLSNIQ